MSLVLCQGNALALPLKDASVHMVCTSPPYWNLRDYGTATWEGGDTHCDHQEAVSLRRDSPGGFHNSTSRGTQPATQAVARQYRSSCGKCGALRVDQQLGLEALHDCLAWARSEPPCDACYICQMRRVFAEVKRVLRDDGTLWCNIGDSYSGNASSGGMGHTTHSKPHRLAHMPTKKGLPEKNLMGIPQRLALALQSDGWYWRSDVIWEKPSCMPESVQDRPTRSHEYVLLFSKAPHYFFDIDAVREPYSEKGLNDARHAYGYGADSKMHTAIKNGVHGAGGLNDPAITRDAFYQHGGRNVRTIWRITAEGYAGAHFATMPTALASRCIKAGCPAGGIVLDPFSGAATTVLTARQMGRHGIGIDLSLDYLRLSRDRLGLTALHEWQHGGSARPVTYDDLPLFTTEAQP